MDWKRIIPLFLGCTCAYSQLTPSIDDYVDAAAIALQKPLRVAQDIDQDQQDQFDSKVASELTSINDPARQGKYLGTLQFQGLLNDRKSVRIWTAKIRIQYGSQIYESWVAYMPTPDVFYWLVPPTQALADGDFQRLNVKLLKMLRNK